VLHHRPAVGSRRGESPPQDAKPEGENMRGRCVWLYVVASACRFGGVPWVCWRSPRGASRAPSKHHRHPCLQWVNQFDFLSESARADHRHSASRHAPSLPTLRGYDVSTARHWLRGGRYRISTNPRTDGVQVGACDSRFYCDCGARASFTGGPSSRASYPIFVGRDFLAAILQPYGCSG
jgi:hypothetical protein